MKREKIPVLSIVVPCFNEEEILENNINKLLKIIKNLSNRNKIDKNSYLYLIDDGSKDKTWDIITKLHHKNSNIKALKFIKNYGIQKALLAGYENSNILGCDCVISIDADLQQDINSIENFIDKYINDSSVDIILGIRNNRNSDTFFKKLAANIFYILAKVLGVNIIKNHSDYRLVSKKALEILMLYKNKNFFFRSFFLNIGLNYSCLYFNVKNSNRKSKFSLLDLAIFALNSLFISNKKSSRILLFYGFFISAFAIFATFLFILLNALCNYIPKYYVVICIIVVFFSGLHIFSIGILGEYLGSILENYNNSPRYLKEKKLE